MDVNVGRFTPEEVRDVVKGVVAQYDPVLTIHEKHISVVCQNGRECEFKVDFSELRRCGLMEKVNEPKLRTLVTKRIDRLFGHTDHVKTKQAANPAPRLAKPAPAPVGDTALDKVIDMLQNFSVRLKRVEAIPDPSGAIDLIHVRINEVTADVATLKTAAKKPPAKRRGRPPGKSKKTSRLGKNIGEPKNV
jgi:hypothetical protein